MAEDIASYQAGWVSDFSPKEIAKTIIKASSDLKTNPQFYRKKAFLLSQKFSWTEIAKESIKIYSKYKYLQ
jgi:glycosyltransferase involved in cell wall biosynthesis